MPIFPTNKLVNFLALFCCSGLLLCLLLFPLTSIAAFTKQINYQGKLTNSSGVAVADTSYTMVFTLYDAPTGGNVVWTETDIVSTQGGLFSLMLGAGTSLDNVNFNQPLYLGLKVNSDAEMTPRKTLGAVASSFTSARLDGNASSTNIDVSNYLNVSGNLTAGSITLGGVTRSTWPSGGGAGGLWATSTDSLVAYPDMADPYAIVIGGSSTTTANSIFEVHGTSTFATTTNDLVLIGETDAMLSDPLASIYYPTGIELLVGGKTNLATDVRAADWGEAFGLAISLGALNVTSNVKASTSSTTAYSVFVGNALNTTFDSPVGINSIQANSLTTAIEADTLVSTEMLENVRSDFSNAGTLTGNATNLYLNNNNNGTITGSYFGLYINNVNGFGLTDSYSIYTDGGKHSFGGDVNINGNATTTGYLTIGSAPAGSNFSNGNLNLQNNLVVGGGITLGGVNRTSWPDSFATTSADYWLTTYDNGSFWSTTSADAWYDTQSVAVNDWQVVGGKLTPTSTIDILATANIDMPAGYFYKYNGEALMVASTTRANYFFGSVGNLEATGQWNTGFGNGSLVSLTTGQENVGFGPGSLSSNTTGSQNLAVGNSALRDNVSGWLNSAIGYRSLESNISGTGNSAIGSFSLLNNTTGVWNTAIGGSSLLFNTEGGENVAIGPGSLGGNTLGSYNVAIGVGAGGHSNQGAASDIYDTLLDDYMTFIGYNATRDGLKIASTSKMTKSVAIGYNAKVGSSSAMVLGGTGVDAVRVGIGTSTPNEILDVYGNIQANGDLASYKLNNIDLAYGSTTLGNYFFGGAGNFTMTGGENYANGTDALHNNTTGNYNVASGFWSLFFNTTGSNNIAIGRNAGNGILLANQRSVIDDNMIFIGEGASRSNAVSSTTALINGVAIGRFAQVATSNAVVFGSSGPYAVKVGIGTSTPGSFLEISGDYTDNSSTYYGQYSSYQFAPNNNNTYPQYGSFLNAIATSSSGISLTSVTGSASYVNHYGAGTMTSAYGLVAGVVNNSSGAITNAYGLYLASTTGSISNSYGIYQAGAGATNYFAGSINLGAGSVYRYNGADLAYGSTTLSNYFFGGAGNLTMTGDHNTAFGPDSLDSVTTGLYNTAMGDDSLTSNTTGGTNSAFGASALRANTTGQANTSVGFNSAYSNTTGDNNTVLGYFAFYRNTTGYGNVIIGAQAGINSGATRSDSDSVIDYNSIFIGYNAGRDGSVIASTTPLFQSVAIGYGANVGTSSAFILGSSGTRVGIGTTTPSSYLDIHAGSNYNSNSFIHVASSTNQNIFLIDKNGTVEIGGRLTSLGVYGATVGATNRDVYVDNTGVLGYVSSSRRYKENIVYTDASSTDWLYDLRPATFDYIDKTKGVEQLGLIAEDVDLINKKIVSYSENGIPETVNYASPYMITAIINEVQKIYHQVQNLVAIVTGHDSRLGTLEQQNADLQARLSALENRSGVIPPVIQTGYGETGYGSP